MIVRASEGSGRSHRHRFSRVTNDRVGRVTNTECGVYPVKIDGTIYLLRETCGAPDRAVPGEVRRNNSEGSAQVPIQRR